MGTLRSGATPDSAQHAASRFNISRAKFGRMGRRRPAPCTLDLSTIGTTLCERGMGVVELQRRLADRGMHISRGGLDRLASDRPLKAANFELLVPVLEKLGITQSEPFLAVPSEK